MNDEARGMSDEQVGELWRFTLGNPGNMPRQQRTETLALIRKLVEERARALFSEYNIGQPHAYEDRWDSLHEIMRNPWIDDARHQFGISRRYGVKP